MGQVGGILVPVGEPTLEACVPSRMYMYIYFRPLLDRIHNFSTCTLDRSYHRIYTLWNRYLLRLYIHLHIPCRCIPPDRRIRHGGEQRDAQLVRRGVPAVCPRNVCEAWYGRSHCVARWAHDHHGTLPVSPLIC